MPEQTDTSIAELYEILVDELRREGETKVNIEDVQGGEPVARKMIESAAYKAGFAEKVSIRKRNGILTGKLDKE